MQMNQSCHSIFKEIIPPVLELNPMTTPNLYAPVSELVKDCITPQKCKCGMNGGERKDYEWQHDVRRVLDELKNENLIGRDNDMWHVTDRYYLYSENSEPILDEFFKEANKQKLREELGLLNNKSAETEIFHGLRFKRDKITVAKLKKLRDYKCQICNESIPIRDNKFYIEGAHILEKGKGGPELPSNILILCPNHHKEFDLGVRSKLIRKGDLIEFELNGRKVRISMKL